MTPWGGGGVGWSVENGIKKIPVESKAVRFTSARALNPLGYSFGDQNFPGSEQLLILGNNLITQFKLSGLSKLHSAKSLEGTSLCNAHSQKRKYLLTPWCRVLLEKLTGLQLVKKFPAFHGTRRFITALTGVRQLSLFWASPIQSISHLLEIHPNIIHPSTPRFPQWSPSLRFPHQDPIHPLLLTLTRHMPSPSHSRFYHPHNIGRGVQII